MGDERENEEWENEERARRKHANKIYNDRIKLIADVLKGVLLLTLGLGFFRFVFDPNGAGIDAVQGILVLSGVSLLFGLVWPILELQLPED